ncbi:MAG: 50S ribosomal protein L11 methyltransferase [Deltaproteobacteria bacterium]|nr:50S ribosomal protein L11 methyltransferase [Deltaproteobacteria bacterium]
MVTQDRFLTFFLPMGPDIDSKLRKLEDILQSLEKTRNISELEVRCRNLDGPDSGSEKIRIGRLIICRPGSLAKVGPEEILIILDAGMTFGTGEHPSTILALTEMQEFFNPPLGWPPRTMANVLDVGTGSGILALAAVFLGAEQVTAIDRDPVAIAVARHNSELNSLTDRIFFQEAGPDQVTGQFDLIMANLVPSVIVRTAQKLTRLLVKDGQMIVAGFADLQAPQVVGALTKAGLLVKKSSSRDGWTVVTAIKDET